MASTIKLLSPKYLVTWIGLAFLYPLTKLPIFIQHFLGQIIGIIFLFLNQERRKIAMINIDKIFKDKNMASKMILQIHDELLFEVTEDELGSVHKIVTTEMEKAIDFNVPIKVDSNYGNSWFEAH